MDRRSREALRLLVSQARRRELETRAANSRVRLRTGGRLEPHVPVSQASPPRTRGSLAA
jgi:hypothetical protein